MAEVSATNPGWVIGKKQSRISHPQEGTTCVNLNGMSYEQKARMVSGNQSVFAARFPKLYSEAGLDVDSAIGALEGKDKVCVSVEQVERFEKQKEKIEKAKHSAPKQTTPANNIGTFNDVMRHELQTDGKADSRLYERAIPAIKQTRAKEEAKKLAEAQEKARLAEEAKTRALAAKTQKTPGELEAQENKLLVARTNAAIKRHELPLDPSLSYFCEPVKADKQAKVAAPLQKGKLDRDGGVTDPNAPAVKYSVLNPDGTPASEQARQNFISLMDPNTCIAKPVRFAYQAEKAENEAKETRLAKAEPPKAAPVNIAASKPKHHAPMAVKTEAPTAQAKEPVKENPNVAVHCELKDKELSAVRGYTCTGEATAFGVTEDEVKAGIQAYKAAHLKELEEKAKAEKRK